MTQIQIEKLSTEEYSHFLAFGEPQKVQSELNADRALILQSMDSDPYTDNHSQLNDWISTLDSTTYPGMTFGYKDTPCMSTAVC